MLPSSRIRLEVRRWRGHSPVTLSRPGGRFSRRPGLRRWRWLRPITTAFPEKGALILQRTRPPLLETPFEVFDQSVLTPNDRFYVRWHWAVIPTAIDVGSFRLAVRGHVEKSLSLSLNEILALPPVVPSISAPATRAAISSRVSPVGNGHMAPWEMRAGPEFA